MDRPTHFQIMRANRPKLARARAQAEHANETVLERINRIEREMTGDWRLKVGDLAVLAEEEKRRDLERVERLLRLRAANQSWWAALWCRKGRLT